MIIKVFMLRLTLRQLSKAVTIMAIVLTVVGTILRVNRKSPLREEHEPSFKVNTDRNLWYDFGAGKVSANIYYSEAVSHKIYAACDAFLMPSLFEPCGLSQLMALRYGTVPIVRETGGLKDTVQPYNEFEGTGTGFSFANYNAHEMLGTIRYAEHIYYDKKREWNKIIDRAMAKDYSWNASALKYQELYDWLIGY